MLNHNLKKNYICFTSRDVNSNCNTDITATILLNYSSALKHVFHTDIFRTFSKIGIYGFYLFTLITKFKVLLIRQIKTGK